jgi:tetratricopeptide (TPR) repeat protein
MTPERFREIGELFHKARETSGDERAALLAQADPELRREVESLLAQPESGAFLNEPALGNVAEMIDDLTVSGAVGGTHPLQLGPYRIESKLGAGGMGEVFRAVDTRLGRAVAIKTAHERFSARFEREARAISSLNHPNICTLYDIGPSYLVMELVEGETLAARIKRGPIPLPSVLTYASQIAAALAEAHAKGVIHRDLKPANIMIAKSGVKVLDFGLAKIAADDMLTVSGEVMGTPAYMAPEQRAAKPADARTDIYAFGGVLYEMLTGERLGGSRKRLASRSLERIVDRCLEDDPARRWQSAAELERELARESARTIPWKAISAAAIVLAVCGGVYMYVHAHRAAKLNDADAIVLADFDNKTGDAVFDGTLRQGLAVELQQSPFLSLVSDRRIEQTMALMGQPKDARLSPEIAQQVCERTGSAATLEGSIVGLGSQYVLGLIARNCSTGNVIDQEQVQAAKREDVLNALSNIASKFRTQAGESLATVQEHSKPLEEATTPSLEALKAYSNGMSVNVSAGNAASVPLFQRAVEIDPQFAMAYANLGLAYSAIGESVLSAESTTKAWQGRDRVSERERFFIDFTYERQVTGNLEKAYQTLELWLQSYPHSDDPGPLDLLGGLATHGTGRFERGIETSQEETTRNPDSIYGYENLATSYFFLDRFSEAQAALDRSASRKLEATDALPFVYNLALLTGREDQMQQAMTLARGKRGMEHQVLHVKALSEARLGHLQAASLSSSEAIDLASQEGARESEASYQAARGVWEAIYDNTAEGKKDATAALALSSGRDVEYAGALALGFSGELSRSEALASDLERRFPEDTFVKFTYVPVLRGLVALQQGKAAESLAELQTALPYELAVNGLNFNHYYLGGLHSAYLRGQALVAVRRYAEAGAEFQKILDHRGLVGPDPIGVLAHLQLGRTYALSGDRAKAKSAYQEFFALWKDADRDVPILKQARTEYAKLQ